MTLFETLPQFTMFVLFFMIGFVTRFFAQITMILCGVVSGSVVKRVRSLSRKVVLIIKKACKIIIERVGLSNQQRKTRRTAHMENANKVKKNASAENSPKQNKKKIEVDHHKERAKQIRVNSRAEKAGRSVTKHHSDRAKRKQGEALVVVLGELAYFITLGILTIKVFSIFEFIDYFWFIPLAVILGVLINDYLTKEVFAKLKKV